MTNGARCFGERTPLAGGHFTPSSSSTAARSHGSGHSADLPPTAERGARRVRRAGPRRMRAGRAHDVASVVDCPG